MSLGWLINNLVGAFLLPPLGLVLAAAAGWMLRKRRPRLGAALFAGSMLVLLALSTQAGARLIAAPLEQRALPLDAPRGAGAQAIVVLGGGRMKHAPEYGGADIPSPYTLGRLRHAARLQRVTGLPLLVSGGSPDGSAAPEAELMARTLREDFAVPVRWLERKSDNTAQNAQFSSALLRREGIDRILLVTDALHMPRAQAAFAQTGLRVVPAPTNFETGGRLSAIDFVPNGGALALSHYALHEWIGLLWYRMRYGVALSIDP